MSAESNEEDDIVVNVEPEEVPEVEVVSQDDGIKELQRQIEAERARRIEAERRAASAEKEAFRARTDVDETNIQLVTNAIDTLRRDDEILKQNYQLAMQSGNFSAAAEIQQEMSGNAAKLLQLSNGLEAMKSKPREPEPKAAPADPVEAFASLLSPRSATWVRRHPEYVTNPTLNRKMIAAHELAVADGLAVDSDEYFAAVEDTLKIKPKPIAEQNATGDDFAAKVVQRRDAAPAAAPVSRGSSSRPNVVRLTAAEREMAEMMGMKPEEYAKNKMALQKEGKIN